MSETPRRGDAACCALLAPWWSSASGPSSSTPPPDSGDPTLFGTWIYCAVMLGAAASCLARARAGPPRATAWALIGAGLLVWTGGEIYYEAALAGSGSVPIPSPADAGYLLFYPLTYAGADRRCCASGSAPSRSPAGSTG